MHDLISNIKFVEKTSDVPVSFDDVLQSSSAQTGDVFFFAFSLLLVIACVVGIFVFIFKRNTLVELLSNSKHVKNSYIYSCTLLRLIVVVACLVVTISFCLFATSKVLYSYADDYDTSEIQERNMSSETLNVYVDIETGELTCDELIINNIENRLKMKTCSVSLCPEVLDIPSLKDAKLEFQGLNTTLFSGVPNSSDFSIDSTNLIRMSKGDTSKISFKIDGIDLNTARQLIGKNVFRVDFKAINTLVDVPLKYQDLVYNGQNQIGVPSGYGYSIRDNEETNAGSYNANLSLVTFDDDEVTWIDGTKADKSIEWLIEKKTVVIEDIVFPEEESTYNGQTRMAPALYVDSSSICSGDFVSVTDTLVTYVDGNNNFVNENAEIKNAGEYNVEAIAISNNTNYQLPSKIERTKSFKINKIVVSVGS